MNRSARFYCIALLLLTAVRALASPDAAVLEAESRRIAAIERAKDAVLAIFPANGRGGGSGVVVSADGYALTNFHVVQPCGYYMQCGMADGAAYDAVLVGLDPTGDVALIKLFGRDVFPHAEMGDSDEARVGDWVFAAGNPFLLAADFQPTITAGIISGVHRYQLPAGTLLEYADCLQTDASVNPGNSGGPLFDDQGMVLGINGRCSFEKRGRVNVGVAYAISINQIKHFMGVLRSGRIVDHATLGARVGRDDEGRAVVKEILDSCDAYRRGLREGDEVVGFGGRPVNSPNSFLNALGIYPKGWRVPMSFRRDGRRHDILVRLAGYHGREELLKAIGAKKSPPPQPTPKPDKNRKKSETLKNAAPAVPQIVADHYKRKEGFSNYYYNELERKNVWDGWMSQSKPGESRGPWKLTGPLASGGEYALVIGESDASLKLSSTEIKWTAGDELGDTLLPPHSGGMMPALFLWRRLAVEGPDRFGDVYYYGTAPLPGSDRFDGLADVLVGSYKGVVCRFYFDPAEGRLLALEMFPDEESDPCEIYFSDYGGKDGSMIPGKMRVRFGDEDFATLRIEGFKIEKQGEN
ncbi:MAG: trypsin-like peptidase domain-containing protein [Pirellulales bacterium]|nr:trypsin-like peptidase domain-containing protein [Pirellulales bacterium]